LTGGHQERFVVVNVVPGSTVEPDGDAPLFVVDAWITAEFNLDVPTDLVLTAETVESLGGKKIGKIIVP